MDGKTPIDVLLAALNVVQTLGLAYIANKWRRATQDTDPAVRSVDERMERDQQVEKVAE